MKKLIAILMTLAMLLSCAAIAESTAKFTEDGKFKVGYICASMNDAYNYFLTTAVQNYFEENAGDDIELVVFDGQSDANKYVEYFEMMLTDGDYGLVCSPAISDFSDYFQQFLDAGTAVINYNVTQPEIEEAAKVTVVLCSDVDCGASITQYVIDKLPEGGKGFILEGKAGMVSVMRRYEGITSTLEGTNLEVLAVQNADWSNDTAYTVVTDWITAYDDFDFIISENDNMALGAIEAIRSAGLNPADYVIVGVDGLYNGAIAIANGDMSCSAQQPTTPYAESMLNIANAIISGERPYDQADSIYFPPNMITPENAQEYVEMYTELGLDQ